MDRNFRPTRNPTVSTPNRSESAAGTPIPQGALVESAFVVSVDIQRYRLDCRTEKTFKPIFDIPFGVPYANRARGEGINFFPEVGSCCYVCTPSEHKAPPFVMCWVMPEDEFGSRGRRLLLNPGDLHFSTRDGNFVFVRRGGIVQIGATPICQTIYLPIRNVLQHMAENYEIHTPAGDLEWTVNRPVERGDGKEGTTFTLAAHEFSDDPITKDESGPKSVALLKIGSHGPSNQTILTLRTRDQGGGTTKTELTLSKSGELLWDVKKSAKFTTLEDFIVEAKRNVSIKSLGGQVEVEANSMVTLKAPQITIICGNTQLQGTGSGMTLIGGKIDLGAAGGAPVVIDSGVLATWFAKVQAAFAACTPPQTVDPPTGYLSGKVNA